MINLDKTSTYIKTDSEKKVIESINFLSQQIKFSFEKSLSLNFPDSYKNIDKIVVCGMGGSRFTPLIIKELFKEEIRIPYILNDDYNLPGLVDKKTLVILSSYSGTTEEIVTCGKKALSRGAKIAAVSRGGEIKTMIDEIKAPGCFFDEKYNLSKQPRIGLGYMIGGHLGILIKMGILKNNKNTVDSAIENLEYLLKDLTTTTPTINNPAKQLALKIYEKYPYYIVSEFLTGVGNGLANQTNETAKSISSFRVVPELNHHLMEGLRFPSDLKKLAIFIFFYSSLYSDPIKKRFTITKEVVEQNKIETVWHEIKGENKIEQAFYLMGFGSYLTLYLSTLYEQNPAIVPYVDFFKKKLKEMR